MVHRDISPDNIMQPDQAAKPILIDFGLVKQTLSQLQSQAGGSASFVGKFGYAPPEQMRLGQCYPSSDLYALGVTALVLLTGQEPRLLMDQETLEWHWRDYVTVSPGFASILEQMLQEKPKARYQTAADVIQALRAVTFDLTWTPDTAMRLANGSPASKPKALSSAFLQRCRQELIQLIGPIADFILETTLAQYPNLTAAELLERLALEIPDPSQANHFRSILSTEIFTATSTIPFAETNSPQPSLPNSTRMSADAQRLNSTPAVITPDFLERCQQALTRCIGPVASLVLDDLIQQAHLSPQALVEAIIAEIPDPQQAQQFRELMNSMS
jgi:serine/threonine-protein kinase